MSQQLTPQKRFRKGATNKGSDHQIHKASKVFNAHSLVDRDLIFLTEALLKVFPDFALGLKNS